MKKLPKAISLFTLCAATLGLVALLAVPGTAVSAGLCCQFSSDCPGTKLCYEPSGGLADCSIAMANYCQEPSGGGGGGGGGGGWDP